MGFRLQPTQISRYLCSIPSTWSNFSNPLHVNYDGSRESSTNHVLSIRSRKICQRSKWTYLPLSGNLNKAVLPQRWKPLVFVVTMSLCNSQIGYPILFFRFLMAWRGCLLYWDKQNVSQWTTSIEVYIVRSCLNLRDIFVHSDWHCAVC